MNKTFLKPKARRNRVVKRRKTKAYFGKACKWGPLLCREEMNKDVPSITHEGEIHTKTL